MPTKRAVVARGVAKTKKKAEPKKPTARAKAELHALSDDELLRAVVIAEQALVEAKQAAAAARKVAASVMQRKRRALLNKLITHGGLEKSHRYYGSEERTNMLNAIIKAGLYPVPKASKKS